MNITIKSNKNNIKSKDKFRDDKELFKIIQYIHDNHEIPNIHNLIKRLFYCYNLNECEKEYNLILKMEERNFKELTYIYYIYYSWNPYSKYNLRELRGYFFEQLTLAYLRDNEKNEDITSEANVHINNYISHTWDFIIKNKCIFIECKFNHTSLKRQNLDKMIGLKNKINKSSIFFSSYSKKEMMIDYLHTLKKDTSTERYSEIIKHLNIISIENYIDKDMFKQQEIRQTDK